MKNATLDGLTVPQKRRLLRQEARDKQRDLIPRLRHAIKVTKQERRRRLQRCAGQCSHRKARLRKAELAAREQLKRRIQRLREQLRAACGQCKVSAKDHELEQLDGLLTQLTAAQEEIRALRRKAGSMRSQRGRAGGLRSAELRSESDDEVRRNVEDDPLLAETWKRLKSRIQGSPHRSRTEAFLEHVQDHPEALEETQRQLERRYDEEAAAMLEEVRQPPKGDVNDLLRLLSKLGQAEKLLQVMPR